MSSPLRLTLTTLSAVLAAAAAAAPPRLVPPRDVTFASLNTSVLRPRVWPFDAGGGGAAATWVQTATCCGYGPFTPTAVAAASEHYGLWDVPCLPDGWPLVAEWGYEFHHNQDNIFPLCGNLTEAGYPAPPPDRDAALRRLAAYWACRAAAARAAATPPPPPGAPTISEIGHYLYAGLSTAFPADAGVVPGTEVGENINSIQLHLAATRGAARAAGQPFLVDFSPWMVGFILDYSAEKFWGAASSPVGGHSVSLHRRAGFAAFMAGAGAHVAEAGAVNYFASSNTSAGGVFALSPLGSVGAELHAFTHGGPGGPEAARGLPYVPLAVVTRLPHGVGLGFFYDGRPWDAFAADAGDARLAAVLAAAWPGSLTVQSQFGTPASESGYLVAGADNADVLAPANLTASLLGAYRAAFFTGGGGGGLDAAACAALADFVAAGGVAVLDAADAAPAVAAGRLPRALVGADLGPPATVVALGARDAQTGWAAAGLPAALALTPAAPLPGAGGAAPLLTLTLLNGTDVVAATVARPHGDDGGAVIVLLAPDAFGAAAHLWSRLADDVAPLAVASNVTADGVAGGVQLLLNRLPDGWVATVVNNGGVTKQPGGAPVVDAAAGRRVTLTLRGGAPVARAWLADGGGPRAPLPVVSGADGAAVTFDVEAGGLRVVGLVLA